jgi:hypothetical protein
MRDFNTVTLRTEKKQYYHDASYCVCLNDGLQPSAISVVAGQASMTPVTRRHKVEHSRSYKPSRQLLDCGGHTRLLSFPTTHFPRQKKNPPHLVSFFFDATPSSLSCYRQNEYYGVAVSRFRCDTNNISSAGTAFLLSDDRLFMVL